MELSLAGYIHLKNNSSLSEMELYNHFYLIEEN